MRRQLDYILVRRNGATVFLIWSPTTPLLDLAMKMRLSLRVLKQHPTTGRPDSTLVHKIMVSFLLAVKKKLKNIQGHACGGMYRSITWDHSLSFM